MSETSKLISEEKKKALVRLFVETSAKAEALRLMKRIDKNDRNMVKQLDWILSTTAGLLRALGVELEVTSFDTPKAERK